MDPQQGTGQLPFLEDVSFTEPLCGSLVLTVGCNDVICGWIRRRLPFSKALKHFPPCEHVRRSIIGSDRNDDERFRSSMLYAVVCMINFASVAASFPSRESSN